MDPSSGFSTDLTFIESFLNKYESGSIFLSKKYFNEGIAVIYIDNESKRNAISGKMMIDFRNCVAELESWSEGKAVILAGVGGNFCSGGDLDFARRIGTPEGGFYMSYWMQYILKRFRELPLISVSLVHGPALGGGSELAVFSDFILVTDDVKLGFVHGKMGITTAWGGGVRLIEKIGATKALEILCTVNVYNAQQCLNLGLADKIIPSANREEEALKYVRQFLNVHHSITRSYKELTNKVNKLTFDEALEIERAEFYPKWGSELNRQALNSNIKHVQNKQ